MRAFIQELRRLGVRLTVNGASLEYDGPEDVMTRSLLEQLRRLKPEIISALTAAEPIPGVDAIEPIELASRWRSAGRGGVSGAAAAAPPGAATGTPSRPRGADPVAPAVGWPATVDGHGKRIGPFTSCADCLEYPDHERVGTGTWVRYGDTPLCLSCARARRERRA